MHNLQIDSPLVFMIAIFNRGQGEKIAPIFSAQGVEFSLLTLGKGTANSKMLNYLGIGETEKTLLMCTMPQKKSLALMTQLKNELDLHKPGHGIAFTIPLSSACCMALPHLTGTKTDCGEYVMEQNYQHDLIIAATNRGFSDEVMEVAKEAGATGGTVVNARGASMKETETFMGMRIHAEKELILILTPAENRVAIMEAIAKKAGMQSDAKTVVFSLPVNGVAGISPIPHME